MNEDVLIVAIVFGTILSAIVIPMLLSVAKKWIESKNSSFDEEAFDRLAKAFIKHKKRIGAAPAKPGSYCYRRGTQKPGK